MESYNTFNSKLAQFFTFLEQHFPARKKEIEKMCNMCALAVNISVKLPAVWFKKNICPLREVIENKDEQGFLDESRKLEMKHKSEGKHQVDFSITEILIEELSSHKLTDKVKNAIWIHLNFLVDRCDKCDNDPTLAYLC